MSGTQKGTTDLGTCDAIVRFVPRFPCFVGAHEPCEPPVAGLRIRRLVVRIPSGALRLPADFITSCFRFGLVRRAEAAGSTPTAALAFDALSSGGTTAFGVSHQAAIADNGPVLTGERDDNDSVSYIAAAADSSRAWPPGTAETFSDQGPRDAVLSGRGPHNDLDVEGS